MIFCKVRAIISKSQPRLGRTFGGVAHLGERDIRIVEVTGSSPAVSTIQKVLKLCGFRAFSFYADF